MKNKLSIRYIVELVITLLLLMVITLVLVRMFVHSRNQSLYAKNLTGAVNVAQNMAELSAAADDNEDFLKLLSKTDRVTDADQNGNVITLRYTSENAGNKGYSVVIMRTEKNGLTEVTIEVFLEDDAPLYTLETAAYHQKGGARE